MVRVTNDEKVSAILTVSINLVLPRPTSHLNWCYHFVAIFVTKKGPNYVTKMNWISNRKTYW